MEAALRIVGICGALISASYYRRNPVCLWAPAQLTGESGTGKDLAAKVLESELFGHERGAFTDAHIQKRGLLESADGGTVFLDEIGEMAPALQSKLLRFLEEKAFKRVGAAADTRVDVRVVASTNRKLEDEVEKGRFRIDLFYRLNVLPISVPPLRARAEDIPLLAEYFIDGFNTEFRKNVLGASTDAYTLLQGYGWPGNIRELRNVIERAMLLSDDSRLEPRDFAALKLAAGSSDEFELPAKGVNMERLECSLVAQALQRCHGNQTRAAALLGLNRDQIRYHVDKFSLSLSA
jgi:transcriptional regulator with PAS, ATPase and Fis domain